MLSVVRVNTTDASLGKRVPFFSNPLRNLTEFVLEYIENPEYPEFIKIELIQDKCDLIDKINIGEQIKVYLNIKGRKWTNKEGKINYFNSLQAWKIEFENENYNQELDHNVNNSQEEENLNEKLPF